MLTMIAVDHGFVVGSRVKPKTMKLVFAVSSLSTQNKGVRAKTGWLEISTIYQNGVTCLPADCCFSELAP